MEQPCSGDRISPFDIDAVKQSNSLRSDNNTSKETHINKIDSNPTILPNSDSNQIHAQESFRPSTMD